MIGDNIYDLDDLSKLIEVKSLNNLYNINFNKTLSKEELNTKLYELDSKFYKINNISDDNIKILIDSYELIKRSINIYDEDFKNLNTAIQFKNGDFELFKGKILMINM